MKIKISYYCSVEFDSSIFYLDWDFIGILGGGINSLSFDWKLWSEISKVYTFLDDNLYTTSLPLSELLFVAAIVTLSSWTLASAVTLFTGIASSMSS